MKDLPGEEKWRIYLNSGVENSSFDKKVAIRRLHWLSWDDIKRTCTCVCGYSKGSSSAAFHRNLGRHVVSNMPSHSEVALLPLLLVFEVNEL